MNTADLTHTVYVAWTRNRRTCLYVGCTVNEHGRLLSHRATGSWYPFADHFDLYDLPTRAAGRSYEAEQIRSLRPLFNRQHHPAPPADPMVELVRRGERPRTADERLTDALAEYREAIRAEELERVRREQESLLGMPVDEWLALTRPTDAELRLCAEATSALLAPAMAALDVTHPPA